jgi:hypothetical protein
MEKQSTLDEWFNNITKGKEATDHKKPVDLPTDIFDNELKNLLKEKLTSVDNEVNETAYYNELFKLWWKYGRNDAVQKFYDAEREYVVYDQTVNFIINSKSKFADYYAEALQKAYSVLSKKRNNERISNRRLPETDRKQVERVFKKVIGSTEKEIRMIEEEDRIMLLMLETLLKSDGDLQLKLSEIKSLLNETITIKQEVSGKLLFDQYGGIIGDKKLQPSIQKIITDTRKRKDFSVLRKFVFDRRLPELFEYYTENEIPLSSIKIELDVYNKTKEVVFDSVFKLEKAILTHENHKAELISLNSENSNKNKTGNIPHKVYLDWLLRKQLIDKQEYLFLNMVRNTFSHNQYPQKRTMELFIKAWNPNKFAEQIIEVYNQKICKIVAEL